VEDPFHRFLQGQGELHADTTNGAVFNLFEAVELAKNRFPIFLGGRLYERDELLFHTAVAIGSRRADVTNMIGADALKRVEKRCKGLDPKSLT
jgi:hypothetical protein